MSIRSIYKKIVKFYQRNYKEYTDKFNEVYTRDNIINWLLDCYNKCDDAKHGRNYSFIYLENNLKYILEYIIGDNIIIVKHDTKEELDWENEYVTTHYIHTYFENLPLSFDEYIGGEEDPEAILDLIVLSIKAYEYYKKNDNKL
jgi:hypothetical protein